MTVAIPIFLVSDKKLWVIDEIHNPHDNIGKGNNNEKSFASKWLEMDSLNTKATSNKNEENEKEIKPS